jgi:hypothetical protein
VGSVVPTSQVGAFRLVVNREYMMFVPVPCTGSPTTYIPSLVSVICVAGLVRSSLMLLVLEELVTPITVRSDEPLMPEMWTTFPKLLPLILNRTLFEARALEPISTPS